MVRGVHTWENWCLISKMYKFRFFIKIMFKGRNIYMEDTYIHIYIWRIRLKVVAGYIFPIRVYSKRVLAVVRHFL